MGRLGFNLARLKAADGKDCECGSIFAEDNENEEKTPSENSRLRQNEAGKKMYLLFFISTTVVACFCIFVVLPQLIDYFTSPSAFGMNNVYNSQKQSVIDILDAERYRRNQERLEIMQKFDALQQNYKLLEREYQKAQQIYRMKLHNAYEEDDSIASEIESKSLQLKSTNDTLVESPVKIVESDGLMDAYEDKSERPQNKEISFNEIAS